MTKIHIKISSIIVRYFTLTPAHLVCVPGSNCITSIANLLDLDRLRASGMLIVTPQINTKDQPPSGNDSAHSGDCFG